MRARGGIKALAKRREKIRNVIFIIKNFLGVSNIREVWVRFKCFFKEVSLIAKKNLISHWKGLSFAFFVISIIKYCLQIVFWVFVILTLLLLLLLSEGGLFTLSKLFKDFFFCLINCWNNKSKFLFCDLYHQNHPPWHLDGIMLFLVFFVVPYKFSLKEEY